MLVSSPPSPYSIPSNTTCLWMYTTWPSLQQDFGLTSPTPFSPKPAPLYCFVMITPFHLPHHLHFLKYCTCTKALYFLLIYLVIYLYFFPLRSHPTHTACLYINDFFSFFLHILSGFHRRWGRPSKRLIPKLNIDHRSCPIANKNCVLLCRSNRVCYLESGF